MITIDKLENYIENLWLRYKEQYNLTNCEFNICNWPEFIQSSYTFRYKHLCNTKKQIINAILYDSNLYCYSFACSLYDIDKLNNVIHRIIIPRENLYKILYNIAYEYKISISDDEILEYLDLVIKHEIGHVLHINKIVNKNGIKDGFLLLNTNYDNDMNEYLNYLNEIDEDIDSEYEYRKASLDKYYQMTDESEANKIVNNNVTRLKELELKIRLGLNGKEI